MSNSSFKMKYSLESRNDSSSRIREDYPGRFPVVVGKRSDIPNSDGKILHFSVNLTYERFKNLVRESPELGPADAMIFFERTVSKSPDALMSVIYQDHKDEDGFLYMTPCLQTVWMIGNDRIIENLFK